MALTPEQIAARQGKLTASAVGALVSGDKERIMALWQEMVGDPRYQRPDFESMWPVQLGEITEKLNLDWYERKSGRRLTRRGEVVFHPDYDWAAATLDGLDEGLPGPVETKHVGGWEKLETIIQRYMPQVQWQMEVTQTKLCALSVIQGAAEPVIEIIDYDKNYADELLARGLRFMQHVWNVTEPVVIEPIAAKVMHDHMREVDMTGNNSYAVAATSWLESRKKATEFDEAASQLKSMMMPDVRRMFGHNLQVKRARNGSIRITPLDRPDAK